MARGKGFGSVEKVTGGYRIRYTGPDGRRYRAGGYATKGTADTALAKIRVAISADKWKPPTDPTTEYTLSAYVAVILARLEGMGRAPRTIEEYRRYWARSIEPTFGRLKLASITPAKVANWYAGLCPTTPTERAHTYAFLRTIMRTAERDGLIDRSPCNIVGAGQVKRAGITTLPTDTEVIMAVGFMPEQYRLMVQIGGGLGLRSGEVRGLKRADIDLGNATVRVVRGVSRSSGREQEREPKTKSGTRTLPIPTYLLPAVADHLTLYTGPGDDALLFPNVHGGIMSAQSLRNYWHKARNAAGIPTCRFHDLRHYAATMAVVRGGATPHEAIRMLGQADSRVLHRYIDDVLGRDREIAERMPALVAR